MVAMSTPDTLSQACIACPVNAKGKPEAKPNTSTTTRWYHETRATGAGVVLTAPSARA
jgi:hypothetical protein